MDNKANLLSFHPIYPREILVNRFNHTQKKHSRDFLTFLKSEKGVVIRQDAGLPNQVGTENVDMQFGSYSTA